MEEGIISRETLEQALAEQVKTHQKLGRILIEKGLISPQYVGQILELQSGVSYISLKDIEIPAELLSLIPDSIARRYQVVPVKKEDSKLYVAMEDPSDLETLDLLKLVSGLEIFPLVSSSYEIESTLNRCYSLQQVVQAAVDEILIFKGPEDEEEKEEKNSAEILRSADEAPIVRLVNSVILTAIHVQASDIHFEPQKDSMRVRHRIDGMLADSIKIPHGAKDAVVSRIKIMAGMDISEKRRSQDGRISAQIENKLFDFRVSTIATTEGEKVVIRILDKSRMLLSLEQLGLLPGELDALQNLIKKPYGVLLFSGPSGSGKTTSLYAILQKLNETSRNIVAIEDPVEYRLPGVNQVQVNTRADLTFANGLRTILRQDPDVIMVGEIRDPETAQIAMEAGLTGHLVFSTIHTNDASSAISRLLEMQIDPYIMSSTLIGVVAQRLVRTVCRYCAEEKPVTDAETLALRLVQSDRKTLPHGKGCKQCMNSGYRGRSAAFEIMGVDVSIRNLIYARESVDVIRRYAIKRGMDLLYTAGLKKLAAGATTLDEVERVINQEG